MARLDTRVSAVAGPQRAQPKEMSTAIVCFLVHSQQPVGHSTGFPVGCSPPSTLPHASWQQPHDTSLILSPQSLRDTVDAMLELGYDSAMKDKLLNSAVALSILSYTSANIRRTAGVLREAGIAERIGGARDRPRMML
jgi:hypothetical protein